MAIASIAVTGKVGQKVLTRAKAIALAGIAIASLAGPLPAARAPASVAGCPGRVERVELEAGHYDPPATLAPDVTRNNGRYQMWSGLSKSTPPEAVTLTCYAAGKPPQRIVLPKKTDRCVLDSGRMRCR